MAKAEKKADLESANQDMENDILILRDALNDAQAGELRQLERRVDALEQRQGRLPGWSALLLTVIAVLAVYTAALWFVLPKVIMPPVPMSPPPGAIGHVPPPGIPSDGAMHGGPDASRAIPPGDPDARMLIDRIFQMMEKAMEMEAQRLEPSAPMAPPSAPPASPADPGV